jgi:hypothetical protein
MYHIDAIVPVNIELKLQKSIIKFQPSMLEIKFAKTPQFFQTLEANLIFLKLDFQQPSLSRKMLLFSFRKNLELKKETVSGKLFSLRDR